MEKQEGQEGQSRPIRTIVCDDGGRTRSDWARMVEIAQRDGGRPLEGTAFADSGAGALEQARLRMVDLVLIDLLMPARPGQGLRVVAPWIARALSRRSAVRHANSPALVLWTSNPMKKMGCETHAFIHLGGHQVIDKEDGPEQQVAQLRAFSDPNHRPQWQPPPDGLTDAQRELLPYLETDLTFAEIGAVLFKSKRTVEDHVETIRKALGGVGRREVISAAKDAGWTWVPLRFLQDPGTDPFSLAR